MRKRSLSIFIILLTIAFPCSAQIDKEFWFAVPTVDDAGQNFDKPAVIRITTFTNPATVTLSLPADPTFNPIIVNVSANNTQTIDLTPFIPLLKTPANNIKSNGVLIQSTESITAYYEIVNYPVCVCNPEIFSLKGKNALGTEFYISSQTVYANDTLRFPNTNTSFDIIATENNTTITITPTKAITGHPANVPFNIILNKGQTYSAVAVFRSAVAHLAGSHVIADKPIAVTLKDDLLFGDGACADLIGDQTVPVNVLGSEYIVAKGNLNPADRVFILAIEDNTNVLFDGSLITTLAKGQTFTSQLTNPNIYITSNKKIYVYHVSGYGCELGSAIIPKITCTGSTSVSTVRTSADPFSITLISKSNNLNSFTLNGNPGIITAANFTVVPGTSGNYFSARIDLSASIPVGGVANIQNSTGKFSLGSLNGTPIGGARYGFFSDFKSSNVSKGEEKICQQDSVQLHAFGGVSYSWLPLAGLSNPNIPDPKASPDITTDYTVIITDDEGCVDSAVTKITVNKKPLASISGNTICLGETGELTLQATEGIGPFNVTYSDLTSTFIKTNITNNSIFHTDPNLAATTNYNLLSIEDASNNCITTPVNNTATITVNSLPVVQLTDDASICEGKDISLTAGGGVSYSWSPSSGLSATDIPGPLANPVTTTKYYVSVTDGNSCVAKDSVTITVNPKPFVDAGNNTIVCKNTTFQLNGTGTGNYEWQPANLVNNNTQLNPNAAISQQTTFYLTIEDAIGCSATDSVKIDVHPSAVFALSPVDTTVCKGNAVNFLASGGNSFIWSPNPLLSSLNVPNPTATVNTETIFSVQVTETTCGETANLSSIVRVLDLPAVTAIKSNDIDCSFQFSKLSATGAASYNWNPVTGLDNPLSQNPTAQPATTTDYIVKGTDLNGCSASDTITVNVSATGNIKAFMPTAFTPNNDGVNDCIGIKNLALNKGFELSIYNRWGQRIFFTKNSTDCWDGRYKGEIQPSAVYIYMYKISTICGDVFKKGTFTLIK